MVTAIQPIADPAPVTTTTRSRSPGTPHACAALLRRDLVLAWRRRGELFLPLLYAVIVTALFPFALGPDPQLLGRIAGGVLLVIVVLAMLPALESMFRADLEDGTLEQWLLAPQPLALLALTRVIAHWLTTVLPLLVVMPLLGALLNLSVKVLPVLMLALLLATPLLALLGAVLSALAAGARRSGILLALMLLPLAVPVVIFAAGAIAAAQSGMPYLAPLTWLAAALVMAIVLAPLACAAALRIAVEA
ncbi:MAG: ABC transporter involved in cytochrome c biogenesis, CcmB subunit [Rhodanobacteraceae bacterium]|jgi:heme exporter protein B|nr:MAG: ABC transporter involved in cytochrome c biogenesis, CcmB subunit [Rhodanobacteraceae bacterium]